MDMLRLFFLFLKQKTAGFLKSGYLNNRRGQAGIEYILLIFISVVVIIGAVSQFNRSFANFLQNYYGNYLVCLIEAGELPALGGAESQVVSVCEDEFVPFTFGEGRPARDPAEAARLRQERLAREAALAKQNAEKAKEEKDKKGDAARAGGSSPSSRGSSMAGSGRGGNRASGARAAEDAEDAKNNPRAAGGFDNRFKDRYSGSTNPENFYAFDGRPTYVQLSEYDFEEEDELAVKQNRLTPEAEKRLRPRKVPYTESVKRDTASVPDVELGFPDFLRYIIIAGIIVALVLFLGNQANSISKSMKK